MNRDLAKKTQMNSQLARVRMKIWRILFEEIKRREDVEFQEEVGINSEMLILKTFNLSLLGFLFTVFFYRRGMVAVSRINLFICRTEKGA